MSRRSGFSWLTAIAKEAARAQRQTEMARRRAIREQERSVREREKQGRLAAGIRVEAAKEDRGRHIQDMIDDAADLNAALVEKIQTLKTILVDALNEKKVFSFDQLKKRKVFPPIVLPVELTREIVPPSEQDFVPSLKSLGWFASIIPGAKAKYKKLVRAEEEKYAANLERCEDILAARKKHVEDFERDYKTAKEDFNKAQQDHNAEVDRSEAA